MKPRGMRIIRGAEAGQYRNLITRLSTMARDIGYEEIILPSVWGLDTFIEKAGDEVLEQMYTFKDKKGRDLCLIPEATAMVREMALQRVARPIKVFYTQKCYRYERPQKGRYREFTQFGLECIGGKDDTAAILVKMLDILGVEYTFNKSVKRGLGYYVADGFEAECPSLGAQKQIAGGGKYDVGEGFAIGIDRLMLCESR